MNTKKENIKLYSLVIVLFIFLLSMYWGIKYDTNDDMIISLAEYNFFKNQAERQGRLGFYFWGLIAKIPYIIDDYKFLYFMRAIGVLSVSLALGLLLGTLLENKNISFITIPTVILLWTNTLHGHNMLTAYPFYITLQVSIFISIIAALVYVAKNNINKYYNALYIILLVYLVFASEIYLQYLLIVLGILYFSIRKSTTETIKIVNYKPIIAILIIFIAAFLIQLLYKIIYPSQYTGNTELNFNYKKIIITNLKLSLGLLPGINLSDNFKNIYLNSNRYILTLSLLISIAYFITIIPLRNLILRNLNTSYKDKIFATSLVLTAVFLPNFLISLTKKYQGWIEQGVSNYLYSSLSYLTFIIILIFGLVFSAKYRFSYYIYVLATAILVFITQTNNFLVAEKMIIQGHKWDLFQLAIKSIDQRSNKAINLNSRFFDGIPQDDYWNSYAKKKLNYTGEINRNQCNKNSYCFEIFKIGTNKTGLIILENNTIKNIYTKGMGNENIKLIGGAIDYKNLIELNQDNIINQKFKLEHDLIGDEKKYTPLTNLIPSDFDGIGFIHDFSKADIIELKSGFYDLEKDNQNSWRWAHSPINFVINKSFDKETYLSIIFTPAVDMIISIDYSGSITKKSVQANTRTSLDFQLKDKIVQHNFKITSNISPLKLNDLDPRKFTLAFSEIKLRN